MKRIFDVIIAGTLLLALSPVILLAALLVRMLLGSPVFFRQRRPGLHGRPFMIYKLRTMIEARDSGGELLPDAERMTRLGKFLRRFSLDELPQLVNVLKGDLSLVGPRPLLMEYLPLYTPEQARRHEVKPGVTGWAQIHGRNAVSWEERFKLDVWYVDHHSFLLDLRILCLTILQLFRAKGISQKGHVTMERFRGGIS